MLSASLSRNIGEVFFDVSWLRPAKIPIFYIPTLLLKAETVVPAL